MTHDNTPQSFHLIIAAAGTGQRFGGAIPKQYQILGHKTILRHTLDNALGWAGIKSLRVIINPEHQSLYTKATQGLNLQPPIHGGAQRHESVEKALKAMADTLDTDDIIMIHDAARPFTRGQDIIKLRHALNTHRAATLATKVCDTLRRQNNSKTIAGDIIEREGLWALQTPQAFRFGDLVAAHDASIDVKKATDDTSLVSNINIETHFITGHRDNIKITTQDDMIMAKSLLSNTYDTRTGIGFDVHAFEDTPSEKALILCGVKMDHKRALAGHSDADVGLHAITDALLGAIGEGDIGLHFPPSDERFKGMDSAIFLEETMSMIHAKGAIINNIDVTLICEAPKITPYRVQMRDNIAQIINIAPTRINVKATTSEKLGFTGREEGIAAQAIASIQVPNQGDNQ